MKILLFLIVLGLSSNSFAQTADSTVLPAFSLNSFPPNAAVYSSDGTLLGKTPIFLDFEVTPFPLTIKKNGFEDQTLIGKNQNSIIEMKPISQTNYSYKMDKNLWFRSDNDQKIWIAVGGIVLSGIVAVHYKLEASSRFRLYNETKDQRYLSETNKYDTISAVGLGGMQVSFGYLVYVLIWE